MQPVTEAPAPELVAIRSPATGEICGRVPNCTEAEVDAAFDRASTAQRGWAAMSFHGRGQALRRLMRTLARDEALLNALIAETGKPRYEAEGIELFYTLELTRFLSGRGGRRALADDVRRPFLFRTKRARVIYHPRGVVGVIGPWNWPLLNNFADAVAPLLAGNAVILKPSRLTPLTSLRVAEVWREIGLPTDVFQVVTGGADTARALVNRVDLIFFTGSIAVGQEIARRAAERVMPAILELGGKSPMIVLADADVPRAAQAAVWSAFANSGQVCIRTERVLVERPVAARFAELVVERVRALRQGVAGGAAPIDIGPIRQREHLAHLTDQIDDARRRGATLAIGGTPVAGLGDHFVAPGVLTGCTADMAVMREETFGPLLPIMTVDDAEHAIRVANDPPGGLSGSVWSRDVARARAVARRLRTGSVCLNDALVNYFCVEAPLGGASPSGLGFRHGPEALRQFCQVETIVEDTAVVGRASSMIAAQIGFPYSDRVLRALRWFMQRWY